MYEPGVGPSIVHIPTHPVCNNRCEFCMDEARGMGDFLHEQRVAQLRAGREHSDMVTFTNGEPTLNSRLPDLAAAAQDLGYRIIGVITNGRRLAQRDFAQALVDAGMNEFTVSAHGPTAAVHDAITGRRGSFVQTRKGLQNLAEIRREQPFIFRLNCTLVCRNLPHMRALVDYARGFGVDIVNFNVVEARGTALADFAGTVPRYPDVVRAAYDSGLDFHDGTVSLSRIPPCAGGLSWAQDEFLLLTTDQVVRFEPAEGKVKGPPCHGCAVDGSCPGVWRGYAEGHGWADLRPVQAEQPGAELRVDLGAPCLNRCADCPDRQRRAPPRSVRQQLADGYLQGYRLARLAGGDALLDRHLPQHLHQARQLGYRHLAIETNGRLLSKPDFLRALLDLGVDEVVVRVHGASSAEADARTGVPGSFAQAVRGVAALVERRQAFRLQVQVPELDPARAAVIQASVLARARRLAGR